MNTTSNCAIATMEHNYQKYTEEEEEDDDQDTISLSNFPTHEDDEESESTDDNLVTTDNSADQDFFEFFTNPSKIPQATSTRHHQIVFCGKIIEQHDDSQPKPIPSFDHFNRSVSFREFHSKLPPATNSAAMSRSVSRRRPCTFGLVKLPAEMELSDMRRRQSRRPPAPMFAAVEDGDREAAMVTSSGCGRRGGGWGGGLLRMLKSRSHLGSALAKTSLGCISLV